MLSSIFIIALIRPARGVPADKASHYLQRRVFDWFKRSQIQTGDDSKQLGYSNFFAPRFQSPRGLARAKRTSLGSIHKRPIYPLKDAFSGRLRQTLNAPRQKILVWPLQSRTFHEIFFGT
jgi:hypothetical protein